MEKEQAENPLCCPVVATLNLISGKWKPMVIHALVDKPMRFGELKKILYPISQKVLTQQLKELESHHLINRQVIDGKVLNVTYSLTEYGMSLNPVLGALYSWGSSNIPFVESPAFSPPSA